MKTLVSRVALAVAVLLMTVPVLARTSPHDTISTVIDGNRVTIVYGRPYTKSPKTGKNRKIWGELVPYGQIWRTGADEATLLITQKTIVVGNATVPPGAYTLWTLPNSNGTAQLIINKQIGQWGIDPHEPSNAYDPKQDLARVDLNKNTVSDVDQFTMTVDKGAAGGGILTLSWETTQWWVPFHVQP